MSNNHPGSIVGPSPWIYESADYQQNVIRITVNYDDTTHALQDAEVFRDPECVYLRIYVGIGGDGTPDSTTHVFPVPAGTTTIKRNVLSQHGFDTIEDILALQFTAGP